MGAILSSGTQSSRGGVPGGLGVAAGNSLSKISPIWRQAERMGTSSLKCLFADGAQSCQEFEFIEV